MMPASADSTPRSGPRVQLRPVTPDDLPWMYEAAIHPRVGGLLRLGGATPSFEEFRHSAWSEVVAQWVLVARQSGRRVGVFALSSADMRNGHAFIATYADPRFVGRGLAIEGAALAIDFVFRMWPFRVLYADVSRPALEQFASILGRVADIDGVRHDYLWLDGKYHDLVMLSFTRSTWSDEGASFVDKLHRASVRRMSSEASRDSL